MADSPNKLKVKILGIETQHEHIVFMRYDCHVCISEGFQALTRLSLHNGSKSIVASLNVVTHKLLLEEGEIGLSNSAAKSLNVKDGDSVDIAHLPPISSLSYVRSKIYGNRLDSNKMNAIVEDIVNENYSNVHLAAFITSCVGKNMDLDEIVYLTKAMIHTGKRIKWWSDTVVDKHCVGGLPGNRTTPIVVAITAAAGLCIPKTSSRAITSPAGTADTMETMAPVNLSREKIKSVVKKENGCIVWGNIAELSPADEILIRVERALDLDSEGQLLASVLSKKVAAGSTHVVIDIPVGRTAKVRNENHAERLKYYFKVIGKAVGLKIKVLITDGEQPVGRGIGPSLEAIDVLSVLRNEKSGPADLRKRSVEITGALLELCSRAGSGEGTDMAEDFISSGKAYDKFISICNAQGGFTEPVYGRYHKDIISITNGIVREIDNRKLAMVAKLAGAPQDPFSGVYFDSPLGKKVKKGQRLYTIYAESQGQLNYACEYLDSLDGNSIIRIA